MNEYWPLMFAVVAGFCLGLFFYGGLYFTVTRGLSSPHPALWFFTSLFLRMSIVLTGLYVVGDGHWLRLIVSLAGFVVAGVIFRIWKNTPSAFAKAGDATHQR